MQRRVINPYDIITAIVAIVSFYSIMNITYLSAILNINSTVTFGIRVLIIFVCNMVILFKKLKVSRLYLLLLLWWVLIIGVSVLYKRDIVYMISIQSRAMAVCSLLQYYAGKPNRLLVLLRVWRDVLFVLCAADIATIFLFPNGLYKGEMYTNVWLLGYKTARLVYNLTLVVLSCYLSYLKKKKISAMALVSVFLSAFSAYVVGATGATIALAVYVVIIMYCIVGSKSFRLISALNKIFTFRVITISYTVLTVLVISGSNFIVRFAQTTLGKNETLSHRTFIWENCLPHIMQHPIIGLGYLTTDFYVQRITLFSLGTNAHNMIFSILITTGIAGLLVYLLILHQSLKSCGKNLDTGNIILIAGLLTILIVGVSSSALVFSAFAFLPMQLMDFQLDKTTEDKIYGK